MRQAKKQHEAHARADAIYAEAEMAARSIRDAAKWAACAACDEIALTAISARIAATSAAQTAYYDTLVVARAAYAAALSAMEREPR